MHIELMQVGKCTMHAIGENVTPKVERKNLVTFRNFLSWLLFIVLHSFFSVPVDETLHRRLLEDDTVTNQTGLPPTQVTCLLNCVYEQPTSTSRDHNVNKWMELQ